MRKRKQKQKRRDIYRERERASRVFVDLAKAWKFLESENKAEQVKEEEEQVNDG